MSTANWFSLSIGTSGSGDKTLVSAVADRRIFIYRLNFCPGANNIIQLWSGPSASGVAMTGAMTILSGQQYRFDEGLVTAADNAAFVLNSQNSVVQSGFVCGWYF